MARVIEYRVLIHALDDVSPSPPLLSLVNDVNELLRQSIGWEPLGGVVCVMGSFDGQDRAFWAQTMVRRAMML